MRQIELGDTVVTDDGDKGFTVRSKPSNTILVWYNQAAEIKLFKWLSEKYGRKVDPDIISVGQAKRELQSRGGSEWEQPGIDDKRPKTVVDKTTAVIDVRRKTNERK